MFLGYPRADDMTSPIEFVRRGIKMDIKLRSSLEGFTFTREGEKGTGVEICPGLQRFITLVDAIISPTAKYILHSVRIGAKTEQVLLRVPYEASLEERGWEHSTGEMESLYHPRFRTSTAAYWFLGDLSVPPPTSIPQAPRA